MGKKEIKSSEPMELNDEMLEGIAGGTFSAMNSQRSQSGLTSNTSNIANSTSTGYRKSSPYSRPGAVTNASQGILIHPSDEVVTENEQQES